MQSPSPSNASRTPTEGQGVNALSCVNCRQRKVKCNRVQPCNHCIRLGLECQFPSRKRTVRRRPRRQDEVLGRLARLEEIVGKVDASQIEAQMAAAGEHEIPLVAAASPKSGEGGPNSRSLSGRTPPAPSDPSIRYLSRDFWSNLCSEVEGLKQALEQASDNEADDQPDDESTPGSVSNHSTVHTGPADSPGFHFILSQPESLFCEPLPHPSPEHMMFLASVYFSNVDIMIKILHRPTTMTTIKSFARFPDPSNIDRGTEALLFAVYFAAVTSLRNDVCLENLHEERSVLLQKFRLATELALGRADYLNSDQIEPLQALTIYVACLRVDNKDRASWALLALAVRLAQAMNLHRDGSGSGLTPFEAEMRRRLWWQLVVLDVRGVEDRGSEAIIASDSYNTHILTNINDDDFGPDTAAPLVDADGPTDVTFSLCTAMSSNLFLYLCDPAGPLHLYSGTAVGSSVASGGGGDGETKNTNASDNTNNKITSNTTHNNTSTTNTNTSRAPVPRLQTEEELLRQVQRLESLFVERADPTHLVSSLASHAVRLIILKLWLTMQYPVVVRSAMSGPGPSTRISHEDVLRTAVAVIELADSERHQPQADRYTWWTHTYVQWHPLAVALAELCTQSSGPLVDRAWRVVDTVFPLWSERIADTKRGRLWRPIKKLHKKAQAVRIEARLKGLGLGQDVNYRVLKVTEDEMKAQVELQARPAAAVATATVRREGGEGAGAEEDAEGEIEHQNMEEGEQGEGMEGAIDLENEEAELLPSFYGDMFTPARLLSQDPMDWLTADHDNGLSGDSYIPDAAEWSTWNEFVNDANGDDSSSVAINNLGSSY